MELLERIRFITNSDYISDLACNRYLTFYQFHEIEEINKCNDCFKLFIVNGMSKETTTLF